MTVRSCDQAEDAWGQRNSGSSREEAAEQQSPAGLKQGQKGNSELRESRRVSILAAKTKEQKT